MFKDFLRLWIRITLGSVFWIIAVQVAWGMLLLLWILAYVKLHAATAVPSRGAFWGGLGFLALMIFGVNVLVIHYARQAAHNRVVKAFVSRVSHDLRSPLASVKLHLETLLKRELSPEQAQVLPGRRLAGPGPPGDEHRGRPHGLPPGTPETADRTAALGLRPISSGAT